MSENNSTPINSDDPHTEAGTALVQQVLSSAGSHALEVAQQFNDFFGYIGREESRKRELTYTTPFRFFNEDVEAFDAAIRKILLDLGVSSTVDFSCDIGLKNRRTISCQSVAEVKVLPDADSSNPETAEMMWSYYHSVNWRALKIPVPYHINLLLLQLGEKMSWEP